MTLWTVSGVTSTRSPWGCSSPPGVPDSAGAGVGNVMVGVVTPKKPSPKLEKTAATTTTAISAIRIFRFRLSTAVTSFQRGLTPALSSNLPQNP